MKEKTLFERICEAAEKKDNEALKNLRVELVDIMEAIKEKDESIEKLTNKLEHLENIEESLDKLINKIAGKWMLDNDPAILNMHQVREQAIVLIPVEEEIED